MRPMFFVVSVILSTRIVKISKRGNNLGVDLRRQELLAVLVDTIPMCNAVNDAILAMPYGKFAQGLNVLFHIIIKDEGDNE